MHRFASDVPLDAIITKLIPKQKHKQQDLVSTYLDTDAGPSTKANDCTLAKSLTGTNITELHNLNLQEADSALKEKMEAKILDNTFSSYDTGFAVVVPEKEKREKRSASMGNIPGVIQAMPLIKVSKLELIKCLTGYARVVPETDADEGKKPKSGIKFWKSETLSLAFTTTQDFDISMGSIHKEIPYVNTKVGPVEGNISDALKLLLVMDEKVPIAPLAEKIVRMCQMHLEGYAIITADGDVISHKRVIPSASIPAKLNINSSTKFICMWLLRILSPLIHASFIDTFDREDLIIACRRMISSYENQRIVNIDYSFNALFIPIEGRTDFSITGAHYSDLINKMNLFHIMSQDGAYTQTELNYNLQIIYIWVLINLTGGRQNDLNVSATNFSLPHDLEELDEYYFNDKETSVTFHTVICYLTSFFLRNTSPPTLYSDDWTGLHTVKNPRLKQMPKIISRADTIL